MELGTTSLRVEVPRTWSLLDGVIVPRPREPDEVSRASAFPDASYHCMTGFVPVVPTFKEAALLVVFTRRLLIVPFVAVTFRAVKFDPEAVEKPSQLVDVTFVKRPLIAFKVVPDASPKPSQPVEVVFVNLPLVEKKFVDVELVDVVIVASKLEILPEVPIMFAVNKFVEVELVVVAFVENKLAIVPFALTRFVIVPLMPLIVVPEAAAKPSQPVEVTLVKTPFVAMRAVTLSVEPVAFVKIN